MLHTRSSRQSRWLLSVIGIFSVLMLLFASPTHARMDMAENETFSDSLSGRGAAGGSGLMSGGGGGSSGSSRGDSGATGYSSDTGRSSGPDDGSRGSSNTSSGSRGGSSSGSNSSGGSSSGGISGGSGDDNDRFGGGGDGDNGGSERSSGGSTGPSVFDRARDAASSAIATFSGYVSNVTRSLSNTLSQVTGRSSGTPTDFSSLGATSDSQVGTTPTSVRTSDGRTFDTSGGPFPSVFNQPSSANPNQPSPAQPSLFGGPGAPTRTNEEIAAILEEAVRSVDISPVDVLPDGTITARVSTGNNSSLTTAPGNVPKTGTNEVTVKEGDTITVEVATDVGPAKVEAVFGPGGVVTKQTVAQQPTTPGSTPAPAQNPLGNLTGDELLPGAALIDTQGNLTRAGAIDLNTITNEGVLAGEPASVQDYRTLDVSPTLDQVSNPDGTLNQFGAEYFGDRTAAGTPMSRSDYEALGASPRAEAVLDNQGRLTEVGASLLIDTLPGDIPTIAQRVELGLIGLQDRTPPPLDEVPRPSQPQTQQPTVAAPDSTRVNPVDPSVPFTDPWADFRNQPGAACGEAGCDTTVLTDVRSLVGDTVQLEFRDIVSGEVQRFAVNERSGQITNLQTGAETFSIDLNGRDVTVGEARGTSDPSGGAVALSIDGEISQYSVGESLPVGSAVNTRNTQDTGTLASTPVQSAPNPVLDTVEGVISSLFGVRQQTTRREPIPDEIVQDVTPPGTTVGTPLRGNAESLLAPSTVVTELPSNFFRDFFVGPPRSIVEFTNVENPNGTPINASWEVDASLAASIQNDLANGVPPENILARVERAEPRSPDQVQLRSYELVETAPPQDTNTYTPQDYLGADNPVAAAERAARETLGTTLSGPNRGAPPALDEMQTFAEAGARERAQRSITETISGTIGLSTNAPAQDSPRANSDVRTAVGDPRDIGTPLADPFDYQVSENLRVATDARIDARNAVAQIEALVENPNLSTSQREVLDTILEDARAADRTASLALQEAALGNSTALTNPDATVTALEQTAQASSRVQRARDIALNVAGTGPDTRDADLAREVATMEAMLADGVFSLAERQAIYNEIINGYVPVANRTTFDLNGTNVTNEITYGNIQLPFDANSAQAVAEALGGRLLEVSEITALENVAVIQPFDYGQPQAFGSDIPAEDLVRVDCGTNCDTLTYGNQKQTVVLPDGRIGITGGINPTTGGPIQPTGVYHSTDYVDYSQGLRIADIEPQVFTPEQVLAELARTADQYVGEYGLTPGRVTNPSGAIASSPRPTENPNRSSNLGVSESPRPTPAPGRGPVTEALSFTLTGLGITRPPTTPGVTTDARLSYGSITPTQPAPIEIMFNSVVGLFGGATNTAAPRPSNTLTGRELVEVLENYNENTPEEITRVSDEFMTSAALSVGNQMLANPNYDYTVPEINAMLGREYAEQNDIETARVHVVSAVHELVASNEPINPNVLNTINGSMRRVNEVAQTSTQTDTPTFQELTVNNITNLRQRVDREVPLTDAVFMGLDLPGVIEVTQTDTVTSGQALAGELINEDELIAAFNEFQQTGQWPELTPDLAEALAEGGMVLASAINRAATYSDVATIGSEFRRSGINRRGNEVWQYTAFDDAVINNTLSEYNPNAEALNAIATAYYDGTLAATYGLDTINPNPMVDHYRNPPQSSAASDRWARQMTLLAEFTSGHVAMDSPTSYNPETPNLGQNQSFMDRISAFPSRAYSAIRGTLSLGPAGDVVVTGTELNVTQSATNPNFRPEATPPSALTQAPQESIRPTQRPNQTVSQPTLLDTITAPVLGTLGLADVFTGVTDQPVNRTAPSTLNQPTVSTAPTPDTTTVSAPPPEPATQFLDRVSNWFTGTNDAATPPSDVASNPVNEPPSIEEYMAMIEANTPPPPSAGPTPNAGVTINQPPTPDTGVPGTNLPATDSALNQNPPGGLFAPAPPTTPQVDVETPASAPTPTADRGEFIDEAGNLTQRGAELVGAIPGEPANPSDETFFDSIARGETPPSPEPTTPARSQTPPTTSPAGPSVEFDQRDRNTVTIDGDQYSLGDTVPGIGTIEELDPADPAGGAVYFEGRTDPLRSTPAASSDRPSDQTPPAPDTAQPTPTATNPDRTDRTPTPTNPTEQPTPTATEPPTAPAPTDRGVLGRVWDGVRSTIGSVFSGDSRTPEERLQDIRDSSEGDQRDDRRPTPTDPATTTAPLDTRTTIDTLLNENEQSDRPGLFDQTDNQPTTEEVPENLVVRTVSTELRVVSAPESRFADTTPTTLEVTTRTDTGTVLSREQVTVAPNEPLYLTNEETDTEVTYTVVARSPEEVQLVADEGVALLTVRSTTPTTVANAQTPFRTRERTTEIEVVNISTQGGTPRALLEVTQLRDDGAVMDRSVRDVGVNTPITVTNAETGETTTYTPRQISAGGAITMVADRTGQTYSLSPGRTTAVRDSYEVPYTANQARQRTVFEPPVRIQTENERLRFGEAGVRQYEGAVPGNGNEGERAGLLERITSFFGGFFGLGSSTAAPTEPAPTTDPFFPTATQ